MVHAWVMGVRYDDIHALFPIYTVQIAGENSPHWYLWIANEPPNIPFHEQIYYNHFKQKQMNRHHEDNSIDTRHRLHHDTHVLMS